MLIAKKITKSSLISGGGHKPQDHLPESAPATCKSHRKKTVNSCRLSTTFWAMPDTGRWRPRSDKTVSQSSSAPSLPAGDANARTPASAPATGRRSLARALHVLLIIRRNRRTLQSQRRVPRARISFSVFPPVSRTPPVRSWHIIVDSPANGLFWKSAAFCRKM